MTGLAMRELWISFRLLALLAVAMAGGILTTVRPNAASDPQALAWGIAAAAVFLSAMAAATLAAERRDGGVAWLALRSVPRSSVLVGWFNALAIPVLIGFAASAVLAWLAFASGSLTPTPVDPASFAVLAASAATVGMEALALGLLVGVLARPLPAAVLAVSLSTAGAAAGLLVPVGPGYLPTAGLGLLAQAGNLERPLSAGLQALGLGLALTGMLMAAAAAAFARADL
ncbi:MAG TPA: hypothetical protein VKU35_05630 [Candidatus Limnocylindria bacterium]|nr:hypothetical protein [Candidatus Limnocylindria bacterium]